MAKQPASSIRITKTRSGATRVRATGSAAQALFDAMCAAHEAPDQTAQEHPQKDAEVAQPVAQDPYGY